MVWGIFSWHTFGPFVPIEHCLNTTDYLSIVADHIHPFMTTVFTSSDGYFQQDNTPCHKAQIMSDWFLEHDNGFTLLKWPPQSPDLNPIKHLWDVVEREIRIIDVQPTNLQQLREAIMWIWTKISEECFQHLVESMPRRIKAVLKSKGGPTRYKQGVPNKVAGKCIGRTYKTNHAFTHLTFFVCVRSFFPLRNIYFVFHWKKKVICFEWHEGE